MLELYDHNTNLELRNYSTTQIILQSYNYNIIVVF